MRVLYQFLWKQKIYKVNYKVEIQVQSLLFLFIQEYEIGQYILLNRKNNLPTI